MTRTTSTPASTPIHIHDAHPRIEIISQGVFGRPAVVRIGQQEHLGFSHDPNTIPVLEETVRELWIREVPLGIALTPCKRMQDFDELDDMEAIESNSEIPVSPLQFEGLAPFRICHLGNARAAIYFSWYCTKDFWNQDSGYRWTLARVKALILARKKSLPSITFHRFLDHGYLAGVEFNLTLKAKSFETIMKTAYELSELIHSIIESGIKPSGQSPQNEVHFVKNTFIPLLKNLGFSGVMFHHGPREFGRDVLFSRKTEFGCPEYWGAQVKLGDVSGRANSFVDLIVNQAQEAFTLPFYDIHTKSQVWISKFVVAITGRFTENAIEKICMKIENRAQRNNMIFLDGEKLEELKASI